MLKLMRKVLMLSLLTDEADQERLSNLARITQLKSRDRPSTDHLSLLCCHHDQAFLALPMSSLFNPVKLVSLMS